MNTYTFAWKKYLPVIKLLLKRSASGGLQTVKLDSMDFNKGNKMTKTSLSFKVEVARGRIITINATPAARDLLEVLSEDSTAKVFIQQNKYEISLNSDFDLKIENVEPAVSEETPAPDAANKEAS